MRMEDDDDQRLELPPGFRFHPTDEELITHYLSPKVIDHTFSAIAIGEVDLNKVEPWDLPWRAKMGEKEWYFFCIRDRKYPTGSRTNRATVAGYWKATGKDKEIFNAKTLVIVGMKKTLVFYKGRAPKGEKTNWVMHEYRLMEGKDHNTTLITKATKSEWVISRIFKKCSGGKKVHISGLIMPNKYTATATATDGSEYASNLPALTDLSPDKEVKTTANNIINIAADHVTCFSNSIAVSSANSLLFPRVISTAATPNNNILFPPAQMVVPFMENTDLLQEQYSIWKLFLDGQNVKADFSQEQSTAGAISSSISSHHGALDLRSVLDQDQFPINSTSVPLDLDILWNY